MIATLKKYITPNVISIALGVLGIIVGWYLYFLSNYKDLAISITNKIDLINVSVPLHNLDIKYNNMNIYDSNSTLELYTVKFENLGNSITEKDYASTIPFGISIKKGQIIELRGLESSNQYIQKSLSPRLVNDKFINFEKVIIDGKSSFSVSFVVLKKIHEHIDIKILGKISDIENLTIKENKEKKNSIIVDLYNNNTTMFLLLSIFIIPILGFIEILIIALIIAIFTPIRKKISENKQHNYFGLQSENYDWNAGNLKTFLSQYVKAYSGLDKSESINSFLAYSYKHNAIKFLKAEYNLYISQFVNLANSILTNMEKIQGLDQEIEKLESQVQVINNLTLKDIRPYDLFNINVLLFNLSQKRSQDIKLPASLDSKYVIYSSLVSAELLKIVEERQKLIENLVETISINKEALYISSIDQLKFLLQRKLIIEKLDNGTIVEETTFIDKLNSVIKYFKIDMEEKKNTNSNTNQSH